MGWGQAPKTSLDADWLKPKNAFLVIVYTFSHINEMTRHFMFVKKGVRVTEFRFALHSLKEYFMKLTVGESDSLLPSCKY